MCRKHHLLPIFFGGRAAVSVDLKEAGPRQMDSNAGCVNNEMPRVAEPHRTMIDTF